VDSEDYDIKLSNVKFELYDENMQLLEILETDENGEAVSQKYPSFNKTYYLREVKTNKEYSLNSELIEINLKNNDTLEMTLENEKIPTKEVVTTIEKTNVIEKTSIMEKTTKVVEVKTLPKTGF
jgi:DUF2075 family protein